MLSKAQKLRGMLTTVLKMRPDFQRYLSGAGRQLKCKFYQKSRTVPHNMFAKFRLIQQKKIFFLNLGFSYGLIFCISETPAAVNNFLYTVF